MLSNDPLNPFATPEQVAAVVRDAFHPGTYDQSVRAQHGVAWPRGNAITAYGIRFPQTPSTIHAIQQYVRAEIGAFLPVVEVVVVPDQGRVVVACDPARVNEAPALPSVS